MTSKVSIRLLAAQSDRRLLELVAGGHERAFEALVQRYRGELLRYCRRMGLSEPRSEDAVQHSLLKAWLALERGVEVRELRAWLYRIVHNTAINIVRRSPEDHSPLADADKVESAAAGADEGFERRLEVRNALSDVAALPPMQREAILLTALDGCSHEEVASALGISDGAVRGLIYRARTTLRGAAAALTPQPLIVWLCGGVAKVAPTAQRLAELSAQGGAGTDVSGPLFKGAALAVTAVVLAAGAAEVPLQRHATSQAKASSSPAHVAREITPAVLVASVVRREASGHTHRSVASTNAPQVRKHGGRHSDASIVRPERRSGRSRDGQDQSQRRHTTGGGVEDETTTSAPSGESPATQSILSATLASSDGHDGGDDGSSSGSSNKGPQQSGAGGEQSGSGGGGPEVREGTSRSSDDSSGSSSDASSGSKGGSDDPNQASSDPEASGS